MAFIFTFLLIASLEASSGKDAVEPEQEIEESKIKDLDMCVGCDKSKEKEIKKDSPPLTVEVRIDPATGKVQYIIKGITLE